MIQNSPQFKQVLARQLGETRFCHEIDFFSHLMIINRYPLMIATEDSKFDDRVIKFRNLSLIQQELFLC